MVLELTHDQNSDLTVLSLDRAKKGNLESNLAVNIIRYTPILLLAKRILSEAGIFASLMEENC